MGFRQRFFAVMATVAMVASACSGGSSAPVDPNAPDIRNVTLTSVTSGINPALDGFSFPNFAAASVGEDFNTDDMVTMFGNGSDVCVDGAMPCELTAEATGWARMVNQARSSGHCEGLAVLSQERFNDKAIPKTFSLNNTADVSHAIMRAFSTQFLNEVQSATKSYSKMSMREIVATLVETLKKGTSQYTLGVYTDSGGHAILPYAVEMPSKDKAIVKIYDSNWPGKDRFVAFDLAKDTWEFSFSGQDPNNDPNIWQGGKGDVDLSPIQARTQGTCPFCGAKSAVGKSTLLLSVAAQSASKGISALYISGEESASQVRLRAERINAIDPQLFLASETDLGAVIAHIDSVKPQLLIIDSVQTIGSSAADGAPGGVTQVREVAGALIRICKDRDITLLLVGHVTKDGSIAGPRLLEHIVDVVLQFEGERHSRLRLIRAIKNRFGASDEVGCFDLSDTGIESVMDPTGLFTSRHSEPVPGTCVTVTLEGRRPLLAEIQALVSAGRENDFGNARRVTSGLDSARTSMTLAVLELRAHVKVGGRDVYAATVGGMKMSEPAADLALALSVASAAKGLALPTDLVAIGEVGLAGEIRKVSGVERRLAEAFRLGFKRALVPAGSDVKIAGMEIVEVSRLDQALTRVKINGE